MIPMSGEEPRYCWVCLANDQDEPSAQWVKPCRCRGTTKWVHQHCLQRWIDEKQSGNASTSVSCSACGTQYSIILPPQSVVLFMMEFTDNSIFKVCPFAAGVVLLGGVYWTAVTYGAVTVMQVLGHSDGMGLMERADPLALLIGLPLIPAGLFLAKMLRWEEWLLRFWRKHSRKLVHIPLLSYLVSSVRIPSWRSELAAAGLADVSSPLSVTRILCGALVLPTVSTIVGKILFSNRPSFQRTLYGCFTFVAIKGALKLYYKQQKWIRHCERQIVDFPESETSPLSNHPTVDTTVHAPEDVGTDSFAENEPLPLE